MRFKHLFFVFTFILFLTSCENQDPPVEIPDPPITAWGEGSVNLNGEEISIQFRAFQKEAGANVDIYHTSNRKILSFKNVPFQVGEHTMFKRDIPLPEDRSYAYYTQANGDAIGPEYVLLEGLNDNHFELTEVDENTLEISGNFNLTFVIDSNWVITDWPGVADTIVLSNGSFHTKVL